VGRGGEAQRKKVSVLGKQKKVPGRGPLLFPTVQKALKQKKGRVRCFQKSHLGESSQAGRKGVQRGGNHGRAQRDL